MSKQREINIEAISKSLFPSQKPVFRSIVYNESPGIILVGFERRAGATTLSAELTRFYALEGTPRIAIIQGSAASKDAHMKVLGDPKKGAQKFGGVESVIFQRSRLVYFNIDTVEVEKVKWGFYDLIIVDDLSMKHFEKREDLHKLARDTRMVAFASVDLKEHDPSIPLQLCKETLFYLHMNRSKL